MSNKCLIIVFRLKRTNVFDMIILSERRSDIMKKMLENCGGFILLYIVIIVGVLLLNARFAELNTQNNAVSEVALLSN